MIRGLAALLLVAVSAHAEFVPTGSMSKPRWRHRATLLADGRVLITDNAREAELYDPRTGSFVFAQGPLPLLQPGHAATLLDDGRVLISGGCHVPQVGRPDFGIYGGRHASIFDPSTETFTQSVDLRESRGEHTATRLRDGRVLIAGGQMLMIGGFSVWRWPTASAEIYDASRGVAQLTGRMRAERVDHTASLLPDGTVLIAGGSWSEPLAETFDPATDTFSPTGPMVFQRSGHTATLLRDGRVLIAGGVTPAEGYPLAIAEIYDPATRSFSPTRAMPCGRTRHAAARLPNGRVLLIGGEGSWPDRDLRTAVVYDPASDRFSEVPPMLVERMDPAATELPSGAILITGGYKIEAPYASPVAELYIEPSSRRRGVKH